jgi:hypothetical protein
VNARLSILGAVDVQRGGAAELNPDYRPGRLLCIPMLLVVWGHALRICQQAP